MLLSLCYLVLRRVLQLAVVRCRSSEFKALEIVVLQRQLAFLRRQTVRQAKTTADRLFLAAASRLLPRERWRSFITPPGNAAAVASTLDGESVDVRESRGSARRCDGRFESWFCVSRETTHGGVSTDCRRAEGLGRTVSARTVRTWLRAAGLGPAGRRRGMTWREVVRRHQHSLFAVDFFTLAREKCQARPQANSDEIPLIDLEARAYAAQKLDQSAAVSRYGFAVHRMQTKRRDISKRRE